jgi:TatD DNase family protein
MAQELLKRGWYLGFDGPITYKNARKALDVLRICPEDRILVETDSPYLAPVPYRGRENQPAYVVRVAETLAQVRGVGLEMLADATFANATRFFANDRPQP